MDNQGFVNHSTLRLQMVDPCWAFPLRVITPRDKIENQL